MTWTVSFPLGTVNRRMPETATNGALSNSHGRALPWAVRVRSMMYPMITLVMASMTLDTTGNTAKKAPPHTVVSFSTSV